MGKVGETLFAGMLLAGGYAAMGTAEYLHHESSVEDDARANECTIGLNQQGQIECFTALAQTQGAEQAALYLAGTALITGGIYGVVKTQSRYPEQDTHNIQP